MRKGVKVLCMLLVLLVGLPGLNVSIASPSDVPVVTPGTDPTALLLGAARYRSFDNVNPPEVFIGVYDLGAGRPYRASGSATWTGQNDLTLVYDPTNNWLTTTISNTIGSFTTTYPNYFEAVRDLKFAGDAATASRMLDSLNYLQIQIKINDPAPTQVYLTGVTLDGSSLGDFHGVNDLILHWQVNEVDLSDGFTLTGTLHLTGPFKNNQEWNRVEIDFGRVDHQGPLHTLSRGCQPADHRYCGCRRQHHRQFADRLRRILSGQRDELVAHVGPGWDFRRSQRSSDCHFPGAGPVRHL